MINGGLAKPSVCRILTLLWAVEDTWTSYTNTNTYTHSVFLMDYYRSSVTHAQKAAITVVKIYGNTHRVGQPFTNGGTLNTCHRSPKAFVEAIL